jgi:CO/xanthine dehydrogenase FAD-binding subunit
MDLATVSHVFRPTGRDRLPPWRAGDAWLGGGTWLFSDPPPELRRLIDLDGFGWPSLTCDDQGLTIAATCRIAELHRFEPLPNWPGTSLFRPCCEALQSSFKIWNTATVGGNLCLALPAGTLITLTAALDGRCLIWCPDGGERCVDVINLVTDINRTVLGPGELLRAITLPAAALARKNVLRHATATRYGRTIAMAIGTLAPDNGSVSFTLASATRRPVRLTFDELPSVATLADAVAAAVPETLCVEDSYGSTAYRRRLIVALAEDVRGELGR